MFSRPIHPATLAALGLLAGAGLALPEAAHAQTYTVAQQEQSPNVVIIAPSAPPPPPAQTAPPPPPSGANAGSYYQPGHWSWNGSTWVWINGTYVTPPQPTAVWVPGRWSAQPNGSFVWIDGHWNG